MTAFVSHSSEDVYFVRLLVKLLEFHGIEYWYSTANLNGGTDLPGEINPALSNADILLIVISGHSASSSRVAHELKIFQKLRPASRIVPLVIDEAGLRALASFGLAGEQYIDFAECLLYGFERVFSLFGLKFLEPRVIQARSKSERRKTSIRERLRFGFWSKYHAATGLGQLENVDARYSKMMQLIDACLLEAKSYRFTSRLDKQFVEPSEVIDKAVKEVWNGFDGIPQKAVFITEAVAECIWERYLVVSIDRRVKGAEARAAT